MINLTGSKLRKKLLAFFFANTESSLYVRELARILEVDPTNLSRELRNLERQGIFTTELRGRLKLYKLNKSFPAFKELKSLIFKTIGVIGVLKDKFQKIHGIDLAMLYGSFAGGVEDQASDIDIFVVSDLPPQTLYDLLPDLEKRLGREINLTIYSVAEFKRKNRANDPFLKNIIKSKHQIIAGKL